MKNEKYYVLLYTTFLLAFCAFLFWDLKDLDFWVENNPGPALTPSIMIFIIFVCLLLLVLEAFVRGGRGRVDSQVMGSNEKAQQSQIIVGVIAILISFTYAGSLNYFGFTKPTLVYLFLVPLFFALTTKYRRSNVSTKIKLAIGYVAFSIAITFVLWFFFQQFLRVPLP